MPRPALSFLFIASLALAAATGCDNRAASSGGAASASASASSPSASAMAAPPPTAAEPAPPPPDDLDLAAVQKALKCPPEAKTGPCRVLAQFASCNKSWNPVSPSGDARWIGRGYLVEGAKTTELVSIVRSKRVPTSEIGAGQIPVKIGIAELGKEEGAAYDQAGRAIRSYERGDLPPRSSPTLEYMKTRDSWPESFASRTVSGQVYANTQGGTFVCEGAKQRLLLVQRSNNRAQSGDGLYAELFATSW